MAERFQPKPPDHEENSDDVFSFLDDTEEAQEPRKDDPFAFLDDEDEDPEPVVQFTFDGTEFREVTEQERDAEASGTQASDTQTAETYDKAFSQSVNAFRKTAKEKASVLENSVTTASGMLGAMSGFFSNASSFCAHCVVSTAAASSSGVSSGISAAGGLGGFGAPQFSIGPDGSYTLTGTVDDIARATGRSREDILAGNVDASELLTAFYDQLGEWVGMVFVFGMVRGLLDSFFDNFVSGAAASTAPKAS
jgi:hypothetical protein